MFNGKKKYITISIMGIFLLVLGFVSYNLFVKSRLVFKENERLFLNGVKEYYDFNLTKLPDNGGYKEVSLADMYKGKWVDILKVGKNMCDETSFVRVINNNDKYRYITYLQCGKYKSEIDSEKPQIVLNGEDTVVIHLNSTYKDGGVKKVTDNKDKLSIENVVIDSSKVNTSKVGTYEVSYKVYDKNYNIGRTSRTVIVAETLSENIKKKKGDNYTYVGDADDNFVLFSGMMFRIVNIDNEGNIKLIADNTISNVSYGDNNLGFKDSNIYTWLNQYFYNSLNKKSMKYVKETTWCYDDQKTAGIISTCNNSIKGKVGLLTVSEYEKAKVNNRSYLTQTSRYYLLNKQDFDKVWITDLYADNALITMNSTDLVGIRPVIVIDKNIFLTSGNGTFNDPYKLQDYTYGKENDKLNTRLIGEYVHYSGYDFRISEVDEDNNIKLVAVDLLETNDHQRFLTALIDNEENLKPDISKEGNLYYKLNNDIINYIIEDLIVKHDFEIPVYEFRKGYNKLENTKINSKISIPASFELFSGVNSYSNNEVIYWLSDYSEDGIITIVNGNNGIAFNADLSNFPENALKIVIYLNSDVKITSGYGTINSPYYVR